jgi:hypothetical protein
MLLDLLEGAELDSIEFHGQFGDHMSVFKGHLSVFRGYLSVFIGHMSVFTKVVRE